MDYLEDSDIKAVWVYGHDTLIGRCHGRGDRRSVARSLSRKIKVQLTEESAMALQKREMLQHVLGGTCSEWNVAKPQDSEDPDTECVLQHKAGYREIKVTVDNRHFENNNIDEIEKLVEAAIKNAR